MGVDTLSFEPTSELTKPDKTVTLSGWNNDRLTFDAKVYLGFIRDVTNLNIGVDGKSEVTCPEMETTAQELESFNFKDSDYDPSYENKKEPERSNSNNTPSATYSQYGRGPNCSEEVEDLSYLLKKYADEGGRLIYYY